MGNSLSSWGGQKRVQKLINSSGLPLQIDSSGEDDVKKPLSTYTEAYPAPGWFTGVKSAVTIKKPASVVYESLSKDLHHVFTPMSECDDEIEEDDGNGKQVIFRIVRIPFKVAFVTGNLKLRLHVYQERKAGKIHFESVKEGRLITRFVADFEILTSQDRPEETIVRLDAKVNCKSLPPPPFKNMVKDVMVNKMDSCMVDLLEYHSEETSDDEFASACEDPVDDLPSVPAPANQKTGYTGFMDMVRSLSAPLRHSFEAIERRISLERPRNVGLQDTAHEHLGQMSSVSPPQSDAASVVSNSSLYKPSSDFQEVRDQIEHVAQKSSSSKPSSQVEVFDAWHSETSILQSPFMNAS